jgi:transcriptional regulator of acetoin/glycerol metabolism
MKDSIETVIRKASNQKKASIRGAPWVDIKRQLVLDALLRNDGKPSAAARDLGCSRTQMYRYRKEYGLI